jgi:hypothetical protein
MLAANPAEVPLEDPTNVFPAKYGLPGKTRMFDAVRGPTGNGHGSGAPRVSTQTFSLT